MYWVSVHCRKFTIHQNASSGVGLSTFLKFTPKSFPLSGLEMLSKAFGLAGLWAKALRTTMHWKLCTKLQQTVTVGQ